MRIMDNMNFKNAIILHGTLGSPDANWFGWLKTKLTAMGIEVWLPALPNPNQPSLRQWADYVHASCPFAIGQDTLIIGHSSGAILALVLAQENHTPVGALVAVSVFYDNSLNWQPNNKLFDVGFDWPAIQKGAAKLLLVHSDNDPYVPLEQARFVADKCHAQIVVLSDQGHFNTEASESYNQFPELLEILRQKGIL